MTEPPIGTATRSASGTKSFDAERRQITVLFSDLVDFTPLAEQLDDEELYELVRRLTVQQETIIKAHGGDIRDFAGDGIMAVFGAPAALEDAPLRACRAALDVQSSMRNMQQEIQSKYGVRPELRIGINSGTAVVGKMGESRAATSSALGSTVNVAARIEGVAEPGTVVISSTTHALVAPFVKSVPLGEQQLKGKSKPEALFRLDAMRTGVARFEAARQKGLSDLIGRTHELALLLAQWKMTQAGTSATVNVVGEAGIGKSRLIYELRQAIVGRDIIVLQGQCRSDSATPFAPFIDIIQDVFGIEENLSRADVERSLRTGLEDLDIDVAATLPYLLNLLGQRSDSDGQALELTAAAEVVGIRTRKTVMDIIGGLCNRSKVALIIEDLHWIDTASEDLLRSMCTSPTERSMLVVASYRPVYTPPWAGAKNAVDLQLTPLSTAHLADLIKAKLGRGDLPEQLVQLIVQKSDGNPLFAEELTSYLAHQGIITETPAGFRIDPKFDPAFLPTNLENLLMERVDHLDTGSRAAIRVASVVGRRFASWIVQEAGDLNGQFSDHLRHLREQELIFPEIESAYADHAFKHALVQDAVYRTLMRPDREELHQRVGVAIETRFPEKLDELSDVLAYHFEKGRVAAKAVLYMALTGRRALKLLSLDEAELRLRQVIRILEDDPGLMDDELFADVLIDMLHLTCWRYNFAEMLALSQRYLPRIERLGEGRQLSRVLQWAGEALICAARFDEADDALQRSLQIGEKLHNEECIMFALWDVMWLFSVRPDGHPNDYIQVTGPRVLRLADDLNDYYHQALARYLLSADCLQRGYVGEAARWAQEAVDLGHATGYAPATSLGLMFLSLCDALRGRLDSALGLAEEAVTRCAGETERAIALGAKGSVLALSGRFDEARELLAYVRRVAHEQTFQVLLTYVEIPYGMARVFSGEVKDGVENLYGAIELFSRWGNSRMVAWAHLALGEISLYEATSEKAPSPESLQRAKQHLEEAVSIGRRAGTDGHVAEALLNLGLAAKASGQYDVARRHLDEACKAATALDWPELVGRIDSALADLEAITGA